MLNLKNCMISKYKISVVIPTFNRASLLDRALGSVFQQNSTEFEVVVSDNCSTDNTTEVVEKYRKHNNFKYNRNESNIGMVGNWQKAICDVATADWFILLSDDDFIIDRFFISNVINAIDSSNPIFVCSGAEIHDVTERCIKEFALPFDGLTPGIELFLSRGKTQPLDSVLCSMAFKRADALELGFFANENNLSCDSELYLKLCTLGDFYYIKTPQTAYTLHQNNLIWSINKYKEFRDGNIDYLINSITFAKSHGVSDHVIKQFIKNTGLKIKLIKTILMLRVSNEYWYIDFLARINKIAPDLIDLVALQVRVLWVFIKPFKSYFYEKYKLISLRSELN